MAKAKTKYPEVNKIKEDAKSIKENTIELGRHIKTDGSVKAEELKEVASEKMSTISEQGREQIMMAENKVREKPLQSVAIAFGAGLALSLLLGRR